MLHNQSTTLLDTVAAKKLDQAIEVLWLIALAVAPIIMVSPTFMYDPIDLPKVTLFRALAGLMAILFTIRVVVVGQWRPATGAHGVGALAAWIRQVPSRWTAVAALAFLIANFISVAASIAPKASLWGRIPIADGYSAYNTLSFFVFFLVVAANLRTLDQCLRIFAAIAVSGAFAAVYGIFQYFGLGFFDLIPQGTRIVSTVGNAIFLGAFLNFSILATMTLALATDRYRRSNGYFLFFAALMAIQVYALLLTQSRGPWVGLAAGTVAFIVLSSITLGRGFASPAIALSLLSWGVAVVAIMAGGPQTSEALESRADTFGAFNTAISSRTEIWNTSFNLISTRPIPTASPPDLGALRYLIGYGPESLGYVYPLGVAQGVESSPNNQVPFQAHNFYIHEMVELGPLGLLAFLCVLGAFGVTTTRILMVRPPELSSTHLLIGIGLLAAIGAWAVQALVGIPSVSDMVPFWGLLGVAVALPGLAGSTPPPRGRGMTPQRKTDRGAQASAKPPTLLGWGLVAGVIIVFGTLIVLQDVRNVIAARTAARGVISAASGDGVRGTALLDKAISLSPNAATYYMQSARILGDLAGQTQDPQTQLFRWTKALNQLETALEADPLNRQAVLKAGEAALQLTLLGQTDRGADALGYYERYANLAPRRWESHYVLGQARYELGLLDLALDALAEASRLNVNPENERLYMDQVRESIRSAQAE